MKYLIDSSAIFHAITENKVDYLNANYTLELARYELGNIIWKESALQNQITKEEALTILKTVKHTLAIMEILQITGKETEILNIATELKTTFYDAAYVFFADEKKTPLITEDLQLIKKNKEQYQRHIA